MALPLSYTTFGNVIRGRFAYVSSSTGNASARSVTCMCDLTQVHYYSVAGTDAFLSIGY